MSEFFQPGQHPDADQLSAFAEDALPAHEREQTLAHLATCADCRTIVSLALPPMEDVPRLQPAPPRRPWFYGWNVAWLAGAGLAALVFLTVHIHNSGHDANMAGGAPTQTAEFHPAAPPQAPAMRPPATIAAPRPAPAPAMKAAPPAAIPRVTAPDEALQSPAAGTTIEGRAIANLPLQSRRYLAQPQQQQMTQQQQLQQQNGALRGSVFGAGTGEVAQGNLSPYTQNNNANYSNRSATAASAPAPVAPPPVLSAQAPPAPAVAAKSAPQTMDTVNVISADGKIATTNAAASMSIAPEAFVDLHKLPSHLAIVSTITRGDQLLALDTAGALFLSTDGSRHWKTIATPWPGRAVRVKLASLPAPAKQPSSLDADSNASTSVISTFDLKRPLGPSISGIITDPTGAIIPGASLKIIDTRTGMVRTTTSDHSGRYAVLGLQPDAYQIDASAPGFAAQRTTVSLTAAQQSIVNMSLRAGATSETVEVSDASALAYDKAPQIARKAAKNAPLSEPSAVFEITTDNGEIWTSADGKNWKRK